MKYLYVFLSLLLASPLYADLIELPDIQLNEIRGTEGIYQKISSINYTLTINDMKHDILLEINKGIINGTIQITNIKLNKDSVSFDLIFNNFETKNLVNTDSIGFNKQYLNQVTYIEGHINHQSHN